MDVTDLLLALLSLLLAYSTFTNTRRKDHQRDGERSGVVTAELNNIKTQLTQVQEDTRAIRQSVSDHGERITRCEEKVDSALRRIKRIEAQLDIAHE